MRNRFQAAILLGAICLTFGAGVEAQLGPPVYVGAIPFDSAEHAHYLSGDTADLRGQAFLRQKGGGVVTCAGNPVLAVPATSYFRNALGLMASGLWLPYQENETAKMLFKNTQCDSEGNFVIALAPGQWFVTTMVSWQVGYKLQGGKLLRHVTVQPFGNTQVFLGEDDITSR